MSKIWRFYDEVTGVLQPGSKLLPNDEAVEANTPEGHLATTVEADYRTQRIDIETGEAVPYSPEPAAQVFDAPTARAERDRRMAESDWVTLRAMRTGQPLPAEWATYMQALADVPEQPGFPAEIVWPEKPAEQ